MSSLNEFILQHSWGKQFPFDPFKMDPSSQSVQSLRPTRVWPRQFIPLDHTEPEESNVEAQVELSVLCSKCEPIRKWFQENAAKLYGDSEQSPSASFEHHESGRFVEASSRNGCHLCTLLWESLLVAEFVPDPDRYEMSKNRKNAEEYFRECESIVLVSPAMKWIAGKELQVMFRSRVLPEPDQIEDPRGSFKDMTSDIKLIVQGGTSPGELVSINTRSQATLNLVRGWLSSCLQSHEGCSLPASMTLPTRLLHIVPSSDGDVVRLVETKGMPELGGLRYSTLSYCWGGQAKVELTTGNIESMMKGIPASQLSHTIQDAIWVTKNLGLEFIWVDSLCIIQNSTQDWSSEALRMSDVYRNCFFSIAAAGASTADEGLFAKRDPLQYASCSLASVGDGRNLLALSSIKCHPVVHSAPWPLDTRGWVLQERLLSPRVIRFGPYISWVCLTCQAAEFGTGDDRIEFWRADMVKKNRFLHSVAYSSDPQPTDLNTIYALWQEIVEEYSTAQLSFKSDRLVALAGVVAAFQAQTGWNPIAGLWDHASLLLRDLLWKVHEGVKTPQRTGLGPTWSWAKVLCEIDHPDWESLTYDRPLASGARWSCGGNEEAIKIFSAILKADITDDVLGPPRHNPKRSRETAMPNWPPEQSWLVKFDIGAPPENAELMLIPLLSRKHSAYRYVGGLVVERSKNFPGCFERLGYWEVRWYFPSDSEGADPELTRVLEFLEQNWEEEGIILI